MAERSLWQQSGSAAAMVSQGRGGPSALIHQVALQQEHGPQEVVHPSPFLVQHLQYPRNLRTHCCHCSTAVGLADNTGNGKP